MCRALSPASFLAVAFNSLQREEIDYDWLNLYRSNLRKIRYKGEDIDVSWDHDMVNYTMGFFASVFSCTDNGIRCDQDHLRVYFDDIIRDLDKALLKTLKDCVKTSESGRDSRLERQKVH